MDLDSVLEHSSFTHFWEKEEEQKRKADVKARKATERQALKMPRKKQQRVKRKQLA